MQIQNISLISMIANYGYKDGSGEYFISIDTDKCDGCKKCVEICPEKVLEIMADDYDELKAVVKEEHRKKLKYSCAICKPTQRVKELPCIEVCKPKAIKHSW